MSNENGTGPVGPFTGAQSHAVEVAQVYDRVLAGTSVRSRYVQMGVGGRVHLLEKGAGPPIVLLHGTGNLAAFFLPLLPAKHLGDLFFQGRRHRAPGPPNALYFETESEDDLPGGLAARHSGSQLTAPAPYPQG